jgi:hypothetical protein
MMKTSNRIHWKALSVPKLGNRPSENEDAFLPVFDHHTYTDQTEFICALADGANQTPFSSLWARLLVKEALAHAFPGEGWADLVSAAQQQWAAELSKIALPWRADEKVRQDAFATLLWFGLRFPDRQAKTGAIWRALAVGDSCLIQIRKRAPIQIFPNLSSSEFGNHPVLLSSNQLRNTAILSTNQNYLVEGTWIPGDGFLLMTVAISAWFIRETENGNSPMISLEEHFLFPPNRQSTFSAWIASLRESGEIKNDDTSVIWVGLDGKLASKPA